MNHGTKSHVTAKNLSRVSNDGVICLRSVVFRVIYHFLRSMLTRDVIRDTSKTNPFSIRSSMDRSPLAKWRIYPLPFVPGKFSGLMNVSSFYVLCALFIVVTRIDFPERSTRKASSQFLMFTKRGNEWTRMLWNLLIGYRLVVFSSFIHFSWRIYGFLFSCK